MGGGANAFKGVLVRRLFVTHLRSVSVEAIVVANYSHAFAFAIFVIVITAHKG
jgi:hypothetical protein